MLRHVTFIIILMMARNTKIINSKNKCFPEIFEKEEGMDWTKISEIITNQGFPIALSVFLIFRIDRFMQELVTTQKEGYKQIFKQVSMVQKTLNKLN